MIVRMRSLTRLVLDAERLEIELTPSFSLAQHLARELGAGRNRLFDRAAT